MGISFFGLFFSLRSSLSLSLHATTETFTTKTKVHILRANVMNQTVQKKMAASPRKSTHKSPVTFFSSDRVNTWSAAPSQLEVRKGFGAFFFFSWRLCIVGAYLLSKPTLANVNTRATLFILPRYHFMYPLFHRHFP